MNLPTVYTTEEILKPHDRSACPRCGRNIALTAGEPCPGCNGVFESYLMNLPQRVQLIMDTIKHATVCVQRQYVHVKGVKFEISSSYRTPTFKVEVHIPQDTVVEIGSGLTADILTKIIENHASAEK